MKTGKGYALRWFTPKVEVDLCGHATLATAFVLSLDPDTAAGTYHFQTNSGELTVTQERDWFTLDFPARPLETPDNTDALVSKVADICGARPVNLPPPPAIAWQSLKTKPLSGPSPLSRPGS